MKLETAMAVMDCYERKQKKDGKVDAVFGKDNPIQLKSWPAADDNCADTLHGIRFERGPTVERKKYWANMPTKRLDIYRRLPLEHPGSRNRVSEQAIVRAHDRGLPLKIKMFATANKAQKSLAATEGKDEAQDWSNPKASC